jgi:hypothetical protein
MPVPDRSEVGAVAGDTMILDVRPAYALPSLLGLWIAENSNRQTLEAARA